MFAFFLAAVGAAFNAVVDESASLSLLQLRSTCMGASLTEHHENKAAACSTCSEACTQCGISAATCYAGSCDDKSGSWCWWYSTTESDSAPSGYTVCSDSVAMLEHEHMTQKQNKEHSSGHMLRKEEQVTEEKTHELNTRPHGKALISSAKHDSSMTGDQNVKGSSLAQCSSDGEAATGYMRTGKCTDAPGDSGSHHICIDLQGATAGGQNFCEVTGQSNWCVEQGECHEDPSQMCDRRGWCICQWAFAGFLANGGSCDQLDVNCDASHMVALEAYRADPAQYSDALACLESKCSLS
jgi:uncharacterized protein (DUF2237 family)